MTDKESNIIRAIELLKMAREHLTIAGAPQSLKKVRSAMKSAEGALRHARRGDLFPKGAQS